MKYILHPFKKLKLGSANCYRIFDENKCYFLKEFQSSFSQNVVVREAKLLAFLANSNIPVALFCKTVDNDFTINYQGHMICLEEYVEGQAYGYDDLPPQLLPEVGIMLGKLHAAMKNDPLPVDMSDEWLEFFSAEKNDRAM